MDRFGPPITLESLRQLFGNTFVLVMGLCVNSPPPQPKSGGLQDEEEVEFKLLVAVVVVVVAISSKVFTGKSVVVTLPTVMALTSTLVGAKYSPG